MNDLSVLNDIPMFSWYAINQFSLFYWYCGKSFLFLLQVIKLSGEFKDFQLEDVKDDNKENREQRYYIGIGEPIPHPADIDIKLDEKIFLSKHNINILTFLLLSWKT